MSSRTSTDHLTRLAACLLLCGLTTLAGAQQPQQKDTAKKPSDRIEKRTYEFKEAGKEMEYALKEFTIDDKRIYLIGHSMGGAGTWHLGTKYPDVWAGLVALARATPHGANGTPRGGKDTPVHSSHGRSSPIDSLAALSVVRPLDPHTRRRPCGRADLRGAFFEQPQRCCSRWLSRPRR